MEEELTPPAKFVVAWHALNIWFLCIMRIIYFEQAQEYYCAHSIAVDCFFAFLLIYHFVAMCFIREFPRLQQRELCIFLVNFSMGLLFMTVHFFFATARLKQHIVPTILGCFIGFVQCCHYLPWFIGVKLTKRNWSKKQKNLEAPPPSPAAAEDVDIADLFELNLLRNANSKDSGIYF